VPVLEQEMKIPVPSLSALRRRLAEHGGRVLHPLAMEDNWVLDNGTRSLAASGRLLRLRRFGERLILTLKGEASFSQGVKTRVEVETDVGDAEHMLTILLGLGFTPVRRYQKRRELWSFQRVFVALDETPMGSFVELEGPADELPSAVQTLELDPGAAVRGTYLDLWSTHRTAHPDAPEDMVFGS
jgi:adenylate cyclase class 2